MLETGILTLLDSIRQLRSLQNYFDTESTYIRTSFSEPELDTIDNLIKNELVLQMNILKEKLQDEMA